MRLVRGSNGQPVTLALAAPLGAGGEAKIYPVSGDRHLAAKLYHAPTDVHARKLAAMLANPPVDPAARHRHISIASIAWPVDVLLASAGGPVAGFLMPRVSGLKPVFEYYNPRARREQSPFFHSLYLHRAARNLAAVVAALHDRGYVIGDVNESNLLVAETSLVTLVDTDSFQVRDGRAVYRCPVGKPDFTPPELQGVGFSQIDRGPEHDRFGLAVLLYQLLMEGAHPFDGKRKAAGEAALRHERIKAGHFPYGSRRCPYEPSPAAPPLEILHPGLQKLFHHCFAKGHRNPRARPDAQTWQEALAEAEAALVECRSNPNHRFDHHLRRCPWCVRAARLGGRDPFPASHAAATAPAAPPKTRPVPHTPPPSKSPIKPRLIFAKTMIRPVSSRPPASAPSFPSLQAVKSRLSRFSLRPPDLKPPALSPRLAGVAALLRTPIHDTPTPWTGLAVLFAILAGVPGLAFWAGLSAVGCGVLEYKRMNRITVGSAVGVGLGAALAARALGMAVWAILSSLIAGLFPALSADGRKAPSFASPAPVVRYSSAFTRSASGQERKPPLSPIMKRERREQNR